MKIGVVLNGRRSADEIAELAQRAETAGLAHFWLSGGSRTKDHFLRLAVAATRTRAITLGPVAISPFEAHPARIAVELLTLQEISHGRAAIVLGGGGDFAATLGVAFKNRVGAVEETMEIVRALARGGEVNHHGRLFQVHGLFSPWREATAPPPLYVGANRPRMLAMAARKADGVMFSDMPEADVASRVARVRAEMATAGRKPAEVRISNWFVWNVQASRGEAFETASRLLGFRLYYIREVAPTLGLAEADVAELEARQREMLRALFEGRASWQPRRELAERLIRHLTLSGGPEDVEACVERLRAFERAGLTEIALSLEGDPARAIALLGERVVPAFRAGGD
ncbi:MAG TPA: LLM class flavin-dependent oxidoreductase [Methylomirabilota bacterium]|nr:LLM class flavin-dependent oxidoreductase [Methylomirabilota bacterium]